MKKNNFKSLMQAAVLVCTPLVIASCDDVFGDVDNPIPSYMSIKEADVNLVLHKDSLDKATYTRTATAATGAEIVYSSSNEKIATVDAKTGKITAVSEGDCDIIVAATGKDSHGNMTYQPAQSSFKVRVKDYRARIALKEGAEIPVYNSARNTSGEKIDLKELLDVWPALGTKNFTINNVGKDPKGVITSVSTDGKITLSGNTGVAKVVARITAVPTSPTDAVSFETKTFKDKNGNVETDTLIVEVKKGVAYVSEYDAKGEAVTSYMFEDYNGEKYTELSSVLKGSEDVYLNAGWYYLDKSITSFTKNIRVKGDVNIILKDGANLTMSGKIMDESAKQSYKLNIFPETKAATGAATFNNILDFKEVNILGATVTSPINAVENVTINNGEVVGNMAGTGIVNIIDGVADDLTGFASVSLKKVTKTAAPEVVDLSHIGTVTLSEGTTADDLSDIKTLTINKAQVTSIWSVESATINDITGTLNLTNVVVNDLIINGGKVTANTIKGFDDKGYAAGKVTMNGGELTVGASLSGEVYAVLGDVEVTKGKFSATSKDYHAVSGKLIGTFFSSTNNAKDSYKKVDGDSSTDKYVKSYDPDAKE